jgi:hypothetical protein
LEAIVQALLKADLRARGPRRNLFSEIPDIRSTLYSVELYLLDRKGATSGSAPPSKVGGAFLPDFREVFWDIPDGLLLVVNRERVIAPVRRLPTAVGRSIDFALPVPGAARTSIASCDDFAHTSRNRLSSGGKSENGRTSDSHDRCRDDSCHLCHRGKSSNKAKRKEEDSDSGQDKGAHG